ESGPIDALAAAGEPGAFFDAAAHLLVEVVGYLFRGEWPDFGRVVGRIADFQSRHPRAEALLEFAGDLLVHDEPLGGDAALAGVLDPRRHRDLDCLVEIGAGQHEERIAPAQLENGLLELRAGSLAEAASGPVAAGERRGDDARILDDALHFFRP